MTKTFMACLFHQKRLLSDPSFNIFQQQTSTGSHWSGQKWISLNAHHVYKQIFHPQLLQSRALKNEQIRNDSGSETGASWLVDEVTTINMVMSFGAFSIKAANSTKRCKRVQFSGCRLSSSLYLVNVLHKVLQSKRDLEK